MKIIHTKISVKHKYSQVEQILLSPLNKRLKENLIEMKDITVSAPGKIILHGEHAVVYGKPAIATSLNLRSYLKLTPTKTSYVSVDLSIVDLSCQWEIRDLQGIATLNTVDLYDPKPASAELMTAIREVVARTNGSSLSDIQSLAVTTFLYLYTALCQSDRPLPSVHVQVLSRLPVGAGLGSSASFSVCLAAALLLHQDYITANKDKTDLMRNENLDLINKWAYQGERIIHGQPSGIDNSVATYGGALLFQSGQITHLDSMPKLRILLTSTGVPRSTKTLVARVRHKHDKYPDVIGPVLESIGAITARSKTTYHSIVTALGSSALGSSALGNTAPENTALENTAPENTALENTALENTAQVNTAECYDDLQDLILLNQQLLQVLGVSHESLEKICHVTLKYGLCSKLTGAGGGGCAFTLLRPDTSPETIEKVKAELEPAGFSCWETEIGCYGVQINNDDFPDS